MNLRRTWETGITLQHLTGSFGIKALAGRVMMQMLGSFAPHLGDIQSQP